ncbi:hypothetical protein [Pseudoduganella aquatica]|uniref:Uncharacterized protein n=1 Tax=Pseudoduganella aquatica TaxID=2660641 RepID=A0A7X4H9T0_9BURK|nr:hypothetical protein [Pseudoduganella aquatica]MYN07290.1 hypothetical protein [Pseudoduganella aquatica]
MATEQDLQALSPSDRERLERLAALAERTPLETLYFVQRDGFEECEESVRENLLAEQSILEQGTVSNDEVMAETRRMIDRYARQKQAAK